MFYFLKVYLHANQIRPNVWKQLVWQCSLYPSCRHHCCLYCYCHCCWGGRAFFSFSISFCFSTATLVFVPRNLPPPNHTNTLVFLQVHDGRHKAHHCANARGLSCSTHNHGRLSFYDDVPAEHHRPCSHCCRRLRWYCRRRL